MGVQHISTANSSCPFVEGSLLLADPSEQAGFVVSNGDKSSDFLVQSLTCSIQCIVMIIHIIEVTTTELVRRVDPFCQEAFAALVDNHMLTNDEELTLLDSLPLSSEDRWITLLYRAKCKKVVELTSSQTMCRPVQHAQQSDLP